MLGLGYENTNKLIYNLLSGITFSHADHHVKNKQDHEDNYIDDLVEEIDKMEHDHSSHDAHEDNSENDNY